MTPKKGPRPNPPKYTENTIQFRVGYGQSDAL